MSTAVQPPPTLIDLATAILRERDQLRRANAELAAERDKLMLANIELAADRRCLADRVYDLEKELAECRGKAVEAPKAGGERTYGRGNTLSYVLRNAANSDGALLTPEWCDDTVHDLAQHIVELQAEVAALKQDRDVLPIGDVARVGDRVAFEWVRGERIEGRIAYAYGRDCANVHVVADNGSGYSTARKHIIAILDRAPSSECGPQGVDANGSPVVGGGR